MMTAPIYRPSFQIDTRYSVMTSGEAHAWRRLLVEQCAGQGILAVLHHIYADTFQCGNRMMSEAFLIQEGIVRSCKPKLMPRDERRAFRLDQAQLLLQHVSHTHSLLGGLYGGANILRATRVHDMRHIVLPGAIITLPMLDPEGLPGSLCADGRIPVGRIMISPADSAHSRMTQHATIRDAMRRLVPIWNILSNGAPLPSVEDLAP